MQLKYGSWTSDNQECRVAIRRVGNRSSDGTYIATITELWTIEGIIVADTPSEINSAIAAREAAFSHANKTAKLIYPDGTIAHILDTTKAKDGVMVTQPVSYIGQQGNEYATQLTWIAELAATFPTRDEDNIIEFSETVEHRGGGRLLIGLPALNTLPQLQVPLTSTPQTIIQFGTLVASGQPTDPYPLHPAPLFPALENNNARTVALTANLKGTTKRVAWRYEFVSPVPILGYPNILN